MAEGFGRQIKALWRHKKADDMASPQTNPENVVSFDILDGSIISEGAAILENLSPEEREEVERVVVLMKRGK